MMSFIWSCRNTDKDRQLESLWMEKQIGDVLQWGDVADETERLLAILLKQS
jgi:hypothetical protein